MGLAPGADNPELEAAIESVRLTCAAAGVVPAIHATDGDDARRRLDAGFAMVTCGTDILLFRRTMAEHLGIARGEVP
jgi:2-keto-3-deoxy-L-rhamnonate aldolase RhmA